jgi:hypothetical protein
MLGERLRSDAQNRWKKGSAAQSTTGVASTNCSQPSSGSPIQCSKGSPTMPPIARSRIGTASAALTQSRRVKSMSSGLGPSSPVITAGSSAMPQIGQAPGPSRMISGCIGQVHCPGLAVEAAVAAFP